MADRCDMQSLVEARHDGRLDEAEAASVARHVLACAACRSHQEELRTLQELAREGAPAALDMISRRRRRVMLLRDASTPPASPRARVRSSQGKFVVAALATVVVVIMVFGAWRTESPRMQHPMLAPPATALHAAASPIRASVAAIGEARFDRAVLRTADVTTETLRLHNGLIDVRVDALSDAQRFVVLTGDAEVEVRGTSFSVHAEDDHLVSVTVREGRVDVRHGNRSRSLLPGESWRQADAVAASEHSSPPESSAQRQPHHGDHPLRPSAEPPPEPTAPDSTSMPDTSSDASQAFASALSKLEAGKYDEASSSLREFARKHPGDARAEDADYLAIVALQRAGRHAAAAQAARRYLARYPKGARRTWVQAIANRTKRNP